MGNEQSKKPELPTQRRSTIRDTEFYRWLKEMRREINRPSSQPSSFGMPPKRGGSSPRPPKNRETRSNTPAFDVFTLNDEKQALEIERDRLLTELENLMSQLQHQNTELVSIKEELEKRTAKRNRSNAEEDAISTLKAKLSDLEADNRRLEEKANTISNKVDKVEREVSKRSMAKAMLCEALMKIGGMFRWSTSPDKKDAKADEKNTPLDKADEKSTAPNEKGAVKQSYMYELTYTYITLLVTMMVATAAHYDLDVSYLAATGTSSLAAMGVCVGLDKTIISFHRQRLIMVVLIVVYVYWFTSATEKIHTGLKFVFCKAVGSYLKGCELQPKPENIGAQKQDTTGAVALQDDGDGGAVDLIGYISVLEESLMGPDSDFVFSLLCTTLGATDAFIATLQQRAVCSKLHATVASALKHSWDNYVARHIFSILTARDVRMMLAEKGKANKVTKYKEAFEDGFNIIIDLHSTSKEVFVKTENPDMATRFLWFLRHVNGKSLRANSSNRLQLHDGEPHSIATTILKMLFGDRDGQINREILLQATVKSILMGQHVENISKYGTEMQEIVEYMKNYPRDEQTTLSDHTKATAIRLLKDK
jgi:hypothetical protein